MKKWIQTADYKVKQDDVVLNIGDYIDYHDQAGENGTDLYKGRWQVLGASDEGNLLIVSESNVTTHCFNKEHTLEGAMEAYSTAVDTLNKICEVYSSGTGATHARSICVEDVDKLTGFDKTKQSGYGCRFTLKSNNPYKNRNEEALIWHDGTCWHSTRPILTRTYYTYTVDRNKKGLPSKVYDMLFGEEDKRYCLSSPYVYACPDPDHIYFGLQGVGYSGVSGFDFVTSKGKYYDHICGVRAVVTLKSDINITPKKVVVSEWKIN